MSRPLQVGRYDRQITIEQLTQGQDDYGLPTETWTTFASVWANAYSGSGRELEAARQISAEVSTQFQIRYVAGVSATMRILYDGLYYDIVHISEVGRRDRIDIFAKARQA